MVGSIITKEEDKEAKEGNYKLVFTSPEALFGSHRDTLVTLKNKMDAVFIDGSHCVVKWGHGNGVDDAFRKYYSRLAELRSILKRSTPFVALTATATDAVRKSIIKDLAMKDCVHLLTVPNKTNIRFSVSEVDPDDILASFKWLIDEVKAKQINTQKVLVFCRKKGSCKGTI
ncbi:hypothetical protein QZH41_008818 [Actinostola sp. cb2023]|nr:hypothetical protein QZH41_008818 [Actinostola sp. cb2023]